MPLKKMIAAGKIRLLLALGILASCGFGWTSSAALADQITPQTKLRVSVIQWMPTKGTYERWDALGGEFEVSQAGDLVLPVIGSLNVGKLDSSALAEEIAKRLQDRLVLVDKPDTTVEILEYPPVYVLGTVKTPGEYKYRTGMTVLQALALGGGLRQADAAQSQKDIQLVTDLQTMDMDIVRCMAAIARLTAESDDATDIQFPPVPASDTAAKQTFAREKIIFVNRANELDRQTKSLAELRDLLKAEIDVLTEKIKASDTSIASAEAELANVTTLVEKGIAVASRKSELERNLANYRTDRLDQLTGIMRARQGIAEATRNGDGLRDRRKTEVATDLQEEQAKLANLKLKREASQKILLDTLAEKSAESKEKGVVAFTVTRRQEGTPVEISATQTTSLLPGDVVTVAFGPQDVAATAAPPVSEEASQ